MKGRCVLAALLLVLNCAAAVDLAKMHSGRQQPLVQLEKQHQQQQQTIGEQHLTAENLAVSLARFKEGIALDGAGLSDGNDVNNIVSKILGKVRNAVVQVVTTQVAFDWFKPWQSNVGSVASGSGFWVKLKGHQYVLTNAHVIQQSATVAIRFPALGEEAIPAEVVAVCHQKDVALVQIKESHMPKLRKLMLANKAGVADLPLANSDTFSQGSVAIAIGFPLGQANLKFSTGIVSGMEHVDDRFFIQITSPINPGNSGGPLLNARGEAMGINTAAIESASNVGYAIPIRHVHELLNSFLPTDGTPLRAIGPDSVSITPAAVRQFPLLGVEMDSATEVTAKYLGYPGDNGVLIRKVSPRGIFNDAGVKPRDLLLEFNGQKLDRFGQSHPGGSMRERMNVYDMAERLPIGTDVTLKVWRNGAEETLKAPFRDDPRHRYPVRWIHEPLREKVEYEVFGGLVVMELTSNHLAKLATQNPTILRFDQDDKRTEQNLVVTALLEQGNIPQWSMTPGDIVTKINGKSVNNLKDFRENFEPNGEFWTIETEDGSLIVLDFKATLASEAQLSQIHNYQPSAAVLKTVAKLLPQQGKDTQPLIPGLAVKRQPAQAPAQQAGGPADDSSDNSGPQLPAKTVPAPNAGNNGPQPGSAPSQRQQAPTAGLPPVAPGLRRRV